jgi:hypothetical protein
MAEVPKGVDTVTSMRPPLSAGDVAVMLEAEFTVNVVALVVPK